MGVPLIEACSKNDDSLENSTNLGAASLNKTLIINLGNSKFNSLSSIGGWMNYKEENLLLIRISEDNIRAFDNACPHQGFRNGWSFISASTALSFSSLLSTFLFVFEE